MCNLNSKWDIQYLAFEPVGELRLLSNIGLVYKIGLKASQNSDQEQPDFCTVLQIITIACLFEMQYIQHL